MKKLSNLTFSLRLLFFILHAFFNLFYIVFAPVIAEDCIGFGLEGGDNTFQMADVHTGVITA